MSIGSYPVLTKPGDCGYYNITITFGDSYTIHNNIVGGVTGRKRRPVTPLVGLVWPRLKIMLYLGILINQKIFIMINNAVMTHLVEKINTEEKLMKELRVKFANCSDVSMKVSYGASIALHRSVINALKEVVEVMLKEVG